MKKTNSYINDKNRKTGNDYKLGFYRHGNENDQMSKQIHPTIL